MLDAPLIKRLTATYSAVVTQVHDKRIAVQVLRYPHGMLLFKSNQELRMARRDRRRAAVVGAAAANRFWMTERGNAELCRPVRQGRVRSDRSPIFLLNTQT